MQAMSIRHPPKPLVKNCALVCCSGFVRKEGLIDISEPNLKTAIPPVVSKCTFRGYPKIDYAVLDQALRLLSNLIEQSLPMYHTIFFGQTRLLRQTPERRDYEFINEVQMLSEKQKDQTRRRLEEMLDPVAVGWHVRAYDIYRLSQQEFWDTDVKKLGIRALHPKLRTGYRYSTPSGGKFHPHKCSLLEDRRIDGRDTKVEVFDLRGVPDGYSLSAWGLIEEAQSEEFAHVPRKFKVEEVDERPAPHTAPQQTSNRPMAPMQTAPRQPDGYTGAPRQVPGSTAAALGGDYVTELTRIIAARAAEYPQNSDPQPVDSEPAGFMDAQFDAMFDITAPLAAPAAPPSAGVNVARVEEDEDAIDIDMFGLQ
ncbi:hypothetical protein CLAFUW4_03461 [Fulvia fulva]|uniref:Uncharacterized protein n=1 Tax=Passalora fulva TaxID=5499 RepID=A0A9Q8P5K3_PASFU|nr:uncharacterized protein CLAFUR5_03440 [Fulvia fulva]KAK4632160.1 hypothetical protein CLAFUR4_03450 [Fulvia fulva]KAK4632900.1 hypothetical protein CLAFUR0_03455 [Fulvia fulva]UJO13996.1 hypothetical protein CLAFUR5_03440 [Fulvia fulva]WPV11562.1 hypothetical protein CLAFUW4_03461 [Fulvia fulva]WPV25822.1 hypothetical protein CLAFUW7_03453 [Fulvia fulva]